ncbi:MAG: diguanylate phosphodiesterase, partial [Mesorhizobium sp.]
MGKTKTESIPADVYIQFVRSLFDNAHMLLIGGACYWILGFMIYLRTHNPLFLAFSFALLSVSLIRYFGIRGFLRTGGAIADVEHAQRLERSYILKGCLQGLGLGALCFVSIYIYPEPFAELAAMSLTLATLVTVVARNYGSPRMVRIFSVTFIGPAALALLLRMDAPSVVLGLMIIPMTFITITGADHVRNVLFSAVIGHKQARNLTRRFDRALNTMSHGLVMLGPDGRVAVANAEAAHLMSLKSADALLGRSIHGLL